MLKFEKKIYRAGVISDESCVPSVGGSINVQNTSKVKIDDYQGLYIGYGRRESSYPYTEQNEYSAETERELNVAVLENDFLYAEFLPDLGGRLWRLYDKKEKRELLYTNDVIRFRNLALRNAWFSGGVEWNIGVIGHSPFTCSPMYTARVRGKNGEEVLRFYEFERIREVYFQIDFWLDANRLLARVRITNPNETVVPMYWWSNIASPEFDGGRIVTDAKRAFNNSDGRGIAVSSIPVTEEGTDVSYYQNIKETIDYFYDIGQHADKFIANFNAHGKGLLQTSSSRLQGRKLFSWGHTEGSRHWQDILTDKAGDYVEIQAGLGKTQYECIPMPPKTSWDWIEVYTAISIPEEKVKGDYQALIGEVKKIISGFNDSKTLDILCDKTKEDIACVKGETVLKGSGFGYLKDYAEHCAPQHLQFELCDRSEKFYAILSGNSGSTAGVKRSFAQERYIIDALEKAVKEDSTDWEIYYLLASYHTYCRNLEYAQRLCEVSMSIDNNAFNNHLMANIKRGQNKKYFYYADKAVKLSGNNYSIAESLIKICLDDKNWEGAVSLCDVNQQILSHPRIRLYHAYALMKTGRIEEAEKELCRDGGIDVYDYREGDKMLNNLYRSIRWLKYNEDPAQVKVPFRYNYVVVNNVGIVE